MEYIGGGGSHNFLVLENREKFVFCYKNAIFLIIQNIRQENKFARISFERIFVSLTLFSNVRKTGEGFGAFRIGSLQWGKDINCFVPFPSPPKVEM